MPLDEGPLERWFALEMHRFHESLVRQRAPLSDLLAEEEPARPRRDGSRHLFDRDALERLRDAVRPHEVHRLRVPLRFRSDDQVEGSVYLQDELASRALKELGLVREDRELREGRLWLAEALAVEVARELPTCVEFVLTG